MPATLTASARRLLCGYRWGRSYESYGEDPLAIAVMGKAYIRGLQYGPGAAGVTPEQNPRGLKKVGSVAKHLSAYNFEGCVGDENYPHCSQYRESFDAIVPDSDLQETYWLAWRRNAPELSGAMCSYSKPAGPQKSCRLGRCLPPRPVPYYAAVCCARVLSVCSSICPLACV